MLSFEVVLVLKVGVLGATGIVGQRFVQLLEDHPWFGLEAVFASERSAGQSYARAVEWCLPTEIPVEASELEVKLLSEGDVFEERLDILFSAVPTEAAEIELRLATKLPIFSNVSKHRMETDVPLVIPEVNSNHLQLIRSQRKRRGWKGFLVTNPNCTAIGLCLPLKPLLDAFGLEEVLVTTMQAISGAGYWNLPSMAILDNLIPYIPKEEEKVETETLKILGLLEEDRIIPADFKISATCARVMVRDGHVEAVLVKTGRESRVEEARDAMENFVGKPQKLRLPTAPERPIRVLDAEDRPQPLYDRDAGRGMTVSVGRLTKKGEWLRFVCLSHNTIRGAAGASLLNAELAYKLGFL